jgi:chromosome partitioning protein
MSTEKQAAIISVVNQKGGVGKTTTAINLSSFLSERGKKVLMVDIDSQSNATSGLGLKSDQIEYSVYDLLMDASSGGKALYPTPFENLHIIPSTKDLAGAEIEMVNLPDREFILKNHLSPFRAFYDYIIIDCPPSLGLLTLNALVASTCTIIPVQCEYFALEGIARLVDTLTLVKETFNPELEIGGIVLTMFDQRTALNRQVVENVKLYFKDLIFDTIIPRNVRLTEAPSHGLPIALYSPTSRGASAYYQLAQEVVNRV